MKKRISNLNIDGNFINKIEIGFTLVTLGIAGALTVGKIRNITPDVNLSTKEIVESLSSSTSLDEIIDEDIIDDLDKLNELVELSERLHRLNIGKYIEGLETEYSFETINPNDLSIMIDEFEELAKNPKIKNDVLSEEDRYFTELALTLDGYEKTVNDNINASGYEDLIDYSILCVKTKVLDTCGFDKSELSNLKISAQQRYSDSVTITYVDPKTKKAYEVTVPPMAEYFSYNYAYKLIENIYDWQSNSNHDVSEKNNGYDHQRNKTILNGIDKLKTFTLMDCEINDKGWFKNTTTISEVKEKIKPKQKIK